MDGCINKRHNAHRIKQINYFKTILMNNFNLTVHPMLVVVDTVPSLALLCLFLLMNLPYYFVFSQRFILHVGGGHSVLKLGPSLEALHGRQKRQDLGHMWTHLST